MCVSVCVCVFLSLLTFVFVFVVLFMYTFFCLSVYFYVCGCRLDEINKYNSLLCSGRGKTYCGQPVSVSVGLSAHIF